MRILKILLVVLAVALILGQVLSIINKVGSSESYDYGFILGKIIVIGVVLIILKLVTKFIDQATH